MTRRAVLKGLVAAGVGVATGTGAYGYLYGRRGLGVTYATLPVNGLPAALSGLRIGLLTDVHRSRWMSDDDVAHAGLAGPLQHRVAIRVERHVAQVAVGVDQTRARHLARPYRVG